MSIRFTLDRAVNDLRHTLHNDFMMQNIISQLVDKINRSKIITAQNKYAINSYFNLPVSSMQKKYPLNTQIMALKPGSLISGESSIKNLLIATAIYYLSDLNNYDYHLINHAFNYGLRANDVVVLLLLNNIYDIETFCTLNQLTGHAKHSITTLKKLSALHKIQFNF